MVYLRFHNLDFGSLSVSFGKWRSSRRADGIGGISYRSKIFSTVNDKVEIIEQIAQCSKYLFCRAVQGAISDGHRSSRKVQANRRRRHICSLGYFHFAAVLSLPAACMSLVLAMSRMRTSCQGSISFQVAGQFNEDRAMA